ncbi:MAG: glycoside hydrolase family 36 protein [Deinococcota bacterium]
MTYCIQQALGFSFNISADAVNEDGLELSTTVTHLSSTSCVLNICVSQQGTESLELSSLAITWQVPVIDMHGLYFGGNPTHELSYLPFNKRARVVAANTGLPFIALTHRDGSARAAFGLLDQYNEVSLHSYLDEATRCYHFKFDKPGTKNGQTLVVEGTWQESLYIFREDVPEMQLATSHKPWYTTLANYRNWVDTHIQPNLMPVPDSAFDPVFCSWTAIHHDVSHHWLTRNLSIAKDLGFKTLITDDGWFLPSDKGLFGDYRYVGQWQPEPSKFPDFKAHVAAVKALGFRYLLWVAPFMVGYDSPKAEEYKDLLTTGQELERFHNLSPWHGATVQVITDTLTTLIEDYDLDGFKLDFIDAVKPTSARTQGSRESTLGHAISETLQTVMSKLQQVKPDLLIEFRNTYTNLASRSYANLYRSSDVPINPSLNRWQAVLLRLLAPDRAVHTDPGLWHPEDSPENVAVHLINLLAAVPMVSIELDKYPKAHLELLHYWLGFYNQYRDTLTHGQFEPIFKQGANPLIYFRGQQETIVALYDDVPIQLEDTACWILNASTQNVVYIDDCGGQFEVIARDKFGAITGQKRVIHPRKLTVEVGGSLELTPLS